MDSMEKEFVVKKLTKSFWLLFSAALVFGLFLPGCATISKENIGDFATINRVPIKDFTSLGLVFTENTIDRNRGQVFTYNELLKLAKELGADTIINVTIDVKREGTRFLGFYLSPKETWYGSALAIRYTEGLLKNSMTITTETGDKTVREEQSVIILSGDGGGDSSGLFSGFGGTNSARKWYKPSTW
jgi:hypothetical protein